MTGTDSAGERAQPHHLTVGRIGRAHGIKGEVRIEVLTDFPDLRFARGVELLIGPSGGEPEGRATVVSSRSHQAALLVRFEGVEDREGAQALTGMELFVPMDAAAPLPVGSFYVHDLIGLQVVALDGSPIGEVRSYMETGATDVVIVRAPNGREHLIPLAAHIVTLVDPAAGRMVIDPLPGLLD